MARNADPLPKPCTSPAQAALAETFKLLPTGLAVALIRVPADPALDLKYRTMRCLWLWPGDCQWHRPLPAS